jgi:predicted membrane protein
MLQTFLNNNSWINLIGDTIGIIGMLCIIVTYYAIEKGKYTRDSLSYYVINLIGAILLTISLIISFNLGSFIIEMFWIVISVEGIVRVLKQRRMNKN